MLQLNENLRLQGVDSDLVAPYANSSIIIHNVFFLLPR